MLLPQGGHLQQDVVLRIPPFSSFKVLRLVGRRGLYPRIDVVGAKSLSASDSDESRALLCTDQVLDRAARNVQALCHLFECQKGAFCTVLVHESIIATPKSSWWVQCKPQLSPARGVQREISIEPPRCRAPMVGCGRLSRA